MGILSKLGIGAGMAAGRTASRPIAAKEPGRGGPTPLAAVGPNRKPEHSEIARNSNGLKEFLWNLDGLGRGTLLDLGPAWQTTLNFFIERGFRVSSEDILRGWKNFVIEEEAQVKQHSGSSANTERGPEGRAERFLKTNLQYQEAAFDAILLWDVLDYLEPELGKLIVAHLTSLLRSGGIVFAMFHSKKPEGFQRYRVADSNTLQVIATPPLFPAQKTYQNREIQDLFARFRTMKSFVGRDQLRETLIIK
jgi:hypothetical protein